jgi:hypothetical protein
MITMTTTNDTRPAGELDPDTEGMLRALFAEVPEADFDGARRAMALMHDSANARRVATMRRLRAADAEARWMRKRRDAAREVGYRGPLTREEASRQQLRRLARGAR